MRGWRRWAGWAGALTMLAGVASATLANPLERRLVYPFDPTPVAPAAVGLDGVQATHLAVEGADLVIWTAPPRKPGGPVIVYFHGNGGNLANRAWRFQMFRDMGYGLVAPAYRGSSGSSGRPSEHLLRRDARAVFDALATLVPGTQPRQTVLYGESLGAAVAIDLAVSMPEGDAPGAVILEAPFTSMPEVAAHLYPNLAALTGLMLNRWPSRERIAKLHQPLMILHGSRDQLIPIDMGRQLYAAAPTEEKTFVELPDAAHDDLWRPETMPRIRGFIETYLVR